MKSIQHVRKKHYETNKRVVTFIDDKWSSDFLEKVEHDPSDERGYRFVLVVVYDLSKYGWGSLQR